MRTKTQLLLAVAGVALSSLSASAQYTYSDRDLQLLFRKAGAQNDLEVNLGSIDFFKSLPAGIDFEINPLNRPNNSYTGPDLTDSLPDALNGVAFSVLGTKNGTSPAQPPRNTSWMTQERTDPNTQSPAPGRYGTTTASNIRSAIAGIAGDGATTGATDHGTQVPANNTAPNLNTPNKINIPTSDPDSFTTKKGNLDGVVGALDYENATPANFSSLPTGSFIRSDLYEFLPGSAGSPAGYLGYFTFKNDGSMSFTPVPEAGRSAAILGGILLLGALFHRHRNLSVSVRNQE